MLCNVFGCIALAISTVHSAILPTHNATIGINRLPVPSLGRGSNIIKIEFQPTNDIKLRVSKF